MNLLSVLIIVQASGVLLSWIGIFFHSKTFRRQLRYSQLSKHKNIMPDDEWPWLIEYFQAFPGSNLKTTFPHFYKTAMAIKRYRELMRLKSRGAVSNKQFKREMKRILPFLNFRQDHLNHGSI